MPATVWYTFQGDQIREIHHREAELAYTELFGGFGPRFYRAPTARPGRSSRGTPTAATATTCTICSPT